MLKKPLKYEEQVEKLKEHGMSIEDEEQAAALLKQINYYRFTGYALQFRKGPNNSDYIKGTAFETVKDIYKFD